MSVTIVVALILVGLLLLVIELLIVPGVSVAGIASLVFFSAGIILAYKYFGGTGGNITLLLTILAIVVTIAVALKPSTWRRISLQTTIDSRVKEEFNSTIRIGERAIAKSKMSPIGEIIIHERVVEAESIGPYIEAGQEVEIVKIEQQKIYVKPLI
ncbi:MAG: NfeD family protein [Bacteroidales bacterium]